MSNLHAYFTLKNEQAFSKLLEASKARKQQLSTPGGSFGKRPTLLTPDFDINTKDWLGRTVLHLACSTIEPYALTYIRMLLSHRAINVNVQDAESKWTPLHRALYCGNLSACQLLLQRPDIDTQIRDNEGLTPFELYSLTLEGTWPLKVGSLPRQGSMKDSEFSADFLTWGSNRNATLGHGDSNDRTFPDHVIMHRTDNLASVEKFLLVQAKAVSMAKLHTSVITNETAHNLRVCGFGSGGRLGHTKHTLYNLQHVPKVPRSVTSVVAAQDHTLIIANHGEVWSWGLNRFSQLGYIVESLAPSHGLGKSSEDPIQAVPRRVLGPLKKEVVVGVAACRTASACWTLGEGDVFTWGTNNGQLGYDSSSQPTQISPRVVTRVQNVIGIALTDSAMACLLHTGDIICFHNDICFRVIFSISDASDPYIPPSASKSPIIAKITGCDGTFAALSMKGDIWTFSVRSRLPNASESGKDLGKKDRSVVKPQRVWTARRLVDSARDVALGTDGDMIICTQLGHVFTRSRTAASPSTPRSTGAAAAITKVTFYRVPFIHRVIHVYANSAGGFGALRLNYCPRPVLVEGNVLEEDIATMRPWAPKRHDLDNKPTEVQSIIKDNSEQEDDQELIPTPKESARELLALLLADQNSRRETKHGLFFGKLEFGANMILQAGMDIPVHRAVLSARSPVLRTIFASEKRHSGNDAIFMEYTNCQSQSNTTPSVLSINGVQPLTVLLLLEFFYTDTIPALDTLPFKDAVQIRREINQLAIILEVDDLLTISDTGITVRASTLGKHLWAAFNACQNNDEESILRAVRPDVFIDLLDRKVACHSIILRSRCLFFKYLFEEDAWTINRWSPDRIITINMQHMEWKGFFYVMKWIYGGEGDTLFDDLGDIDTVHNFIDLLFEVISMAGELLLDRLMSVCSSILIRFVNISNAPSLLARATHYNVFPIITSLQDYITCNLEAILESRLLDNNREREYDVEDLLPALGAAIRARQADSSPLVRTGLVVDELMKRHADWLELQDIPMPIIRSQSFSSEQQSPRLMQTTPAPSRISSTIPKLNLEDDIFHMDENSAVSLLASVPSQQSMSSVDRGSTKKVWKSKTIHDMPKVDFKTVMAEAAAQTVPVTTSASGREKGLPVDQSRTHSARVIPVTPPPSYHAPLSSRTSKALPWNASVQRPSTVASSISVSAFNIPQGHQNETSGPAKSPVKVEPMAPPRPVSVPSPGSPLSSNPNKYPPIIRRGPNDAPAWFPKLPGEDSSPPVAGLSFVAIQQQQLAQAKPPKEKLTLRQIQEEERAKREEEDFLKWWAAEEARVAKESSKADVRASNTRNVDTSNQNRRGKGHGRKAGH